jgi:hypothetical protein
MGDGGRTRGDAAADCGVDTSRAAEDAFLDLDAI